MNQLYFDGIKNEMKFWSQGKNVKNIVFLEFVLIADDSERKKKIE